MVLAQQQTCRTVGQNPGHKHEHMRNFSHFIFDKMPKAEAEERIFYKWCRENWNPHAEE